ncbi:MAG: outer membrane beta-barrel domain-containing protein [Smithellaceae bacterium]
MKKIILFLVVMALLSVVPTGYAQVKAGSVSVTPFIGGYTFEGNQNYKTAPVFGIRGGYNFTKNWAAEGFFYYVPTKINDIVGDDDLKLTAYGVEALYNFMPDKRLVPFLAVGAGGSHYSPPGGVDSTNKFTVDYGAGVKYFLTDYLALRADIRHTLPLNDRYNDLLYTFGINFAFGGVKKAKVAETVQEAVAPQAAAPVEVVIDSDKDGVPDNLDQCPDTPAGVAVDKDGCPFDSDKDGVPDYLDKCPNTPIGVTVDKDGCSPPVVEEVKAQAAEAVPEIVEKGRTTLNVLFATNKAVIQKNSFQDIDNLAAVMKKYPELNVTIEGHTDNVGSAVYNKKLSQRRAEAVKIYMVKKAGIDAKRLTAKGFGLEKPIASNATKEGRQQNRRVEAAVNYIIKK